MAYCKPLARTHLGITRDTALPAWTIFICLSNIRWKGNTLQKVAGDMSGAVWRGRVSICVRISQEISLSRLTLTFAEELHVVGHLVLFGIHLRLGGHVDFPYQELHVVVALDVVTLVLQQSQTLLLFVPVAIEAILGDRTRAKRNGGICKSLAGKYKYSSDKQPNKSGFFPLFSSENKISAYLKVFWY